MQASANSCSDLKPHDEGGLSCQSKQAITQGCFDIGYPDDQVMPVCMREDRQFDERTKTIIIQPWVGA